MGRFILLLSALLWMSPAAAADRPPLVLAAASLQESLSTVADAWAALGHPRPVLSFAATSALARQVVAGAPADILISADEQWMDYVAARGLVRAGTRLSLLGNRLALVAPAASPRVSLAIVPGFPIAKALGHGRLAVADPDSVPAGRYARDALIRLRVWNFVSTRLAPAENVRAALAFVERGEAPYGIVYATDARASAKVRLVDYFPANSHARISYAAGILTRTQSRDSRAFLRFLASPAGQAIFRRFGFTAP